jgi:PleD family two-component response regulator
MCEVRYITSNEYNKRLKLNILIVDDDENASELFKEILELRGHNVITLNEGVRCISNIQNNTYDIIFLDYHIGDIDGVDLADFIKDIFKSNALIFAYTGDNSSSAVSKFKETGMNGAIIKPIDYNLINKIMVQIENTNKINKKNINQEIINKLGLIKDKSLICF